MTDPITDGSLVTLRCKLSYGAGQILDRGEHTRTITIGSGDSISGQEALLRGLRAG